MELQSVLAIFWLIAGGLSFYFSIGNARVWTSIAVGFFLILLGEIIPGALPFLPGLGDDGGSERRVEIRPMERRPGLLWLIGLGR